MINELLSNIEALVILYAPVVLSYATQIIEWLIYNRRLKRLNLGRQIAPVLSELQDLNRYNDYLQKQNEELKNNCGALFKYCEAVVRENKTLKEEIKNQIDAQNKQLCELVQKNVELQAEVRSK